MHEERGAHDMSLRKRSQRRRDVGANKTRAPAAHPTACLLSPPPPPQLSGKTDGKVGGASWPAARGTAGRQGGSRGLRWVAAARGAACKRRSEETTHEVGAAGGGSCGQQAVRCVDDGVRKDVEGTVRRAGSRQGAARTEVCVGGTRGGWSAPLGATGMTRAGGTG